MKPTINQSRKAQEFKRLGLSRTRPLHPRTISTGLSKHAPDIQDAIEIPKRVTLSDSEIRERILNGPLSEAMRLMHLITRPTYVFTPLHNAMCKAIEENNMVIVLSYRGAGKSELCDVTLALTLMVRNPDIKILIVSRLAKTAKQFGDFIRRTIESNERFIKLFGNLKPANAGRPGGVTWNSDEITISTRKVWQKVPTLRVCPANGSVVGYHYDVIIADDLVIEDDAYSRAEREKLENWYHNSLYPTWKGNNQEEELDGVTEDEKLDIKDGYRFIVIGTRWSKDDLYGKLMELKNPDKPNGKEFAVQRWPALTKNKRTGEWQSSCPERMPVKRLLLLKSQMGDRRFNMQYNNSTKENANAYFFENQINWFEDYEVRSDYSVVITVIEPKTVYREGQERVITVKRRVICRRVYLGVDLASRVKRSADFFVIAVVAVDDKANFYLLEVYQDKLEMTDQINKIEEFYYPFRANKVGIEDVAYQHVLPATLKANTAIPVVGVPRGKATKEGRAEKLQPFFKNGKVWFRRSMRETLRQVVVDEFLNFPDHPNDDIFDAFETAVSLAYEDYLKNERFKLFIDEKVQARYKEEEEEEILEETDLQAETNQTKQEGLSNVWEALIKMNQKT